MSVKNTVIYKAIDKNTNITYEKSYVKTIWVYAKGFTVLSVTDVFNNVSSIDLPANYPCNISFSSQIKK